MLTMDQGALFYDLNGTLWETKVFRFWVKYSWKAEIVPKLKGVECSGSTVPLELSNTDQKIASQNLLVVATGYWPLSE